MSGSDVTRQERLFNSCVLILRRTDACRVKWVRFESIVADTFETSHEVLAPAIRTDTTLLPTFVDVTTGATSFVEFVTFGTLTLEAAFRVDTSAASAEGRITRTLVDV